MHACVTATAATVENVENVLRAAHPTNTASLLLACDFHRCSVLLLSPQKHFRLSHVWIFCSKPRYPWHKQTHQVGQKNRVDLSKVVMRDFLQSSQTWTCRNLAEMLSRWNMHIYPGYPNKNILSKRIMPKSLTSTNFTTCSSFFFFFFYHKLM